MSYHRDLLEQARHLASKEPRRPRQASLRRAVSAAYYSVFHMLVDAASRFLIRGQDELRSTLSRAFSHQDMRDVAKQYAQGKVPAKISAAAPGPPPSDLQRVAKAFISLQEARHEADYDLSRSFTRAEVLDLILEAERAHADWDLFWKGKPADGMVFLVALFATRKIRS